MDVRAIATGYYGNQVRVPDTPSAEFTLGARIDFSASWMEPIGWNPETDPLDHDGDGDKGGMAGLSGMTVVKLRDLAKERNVDLSGITAKADIVAALELAAEATPAVPLTGDEKIAKAKELSGRDDLTVEQADEILAAAASNDI